MRREKPLEPDFSAARGRRLLVALSGGADSVALIHLLAEARERCDLTLIAAHVDHGIRLDSEADAAFCRELCQRLDIPLYCVRLDVPASARLNRTGLETEARAQRYRALERFRRETDADYIVLAHHMDDQAETVLMHLGRGAGVNGACGMRELADGFYRPLLGCRKAQLIEYLSANQWEWREDATNHVGDNPRNALRLHAIPELEKCYPQFVPALARYALAAQAENDYIDAQTVMFLSKSASQCPVCAWIDVDPAPHPAILRRAIRAMSPCELSWDQVAALERLCADVRGRIDIGREAFAERTGRRLYFVPKRSAAIAPEPLNLTGMTALGRICEIDAAESAPLASMANPMIQVLDADALDGAVLRTRREGDRFRPLGCGDRLLSDYLIDRKINRPMRDALALAARGDRVLWVCGIGISEDAKLRAETRRAVRLECRYTFDMSLGFNK